MQTASECQENPEVVEINLYYLRAVKHSEVVF
jgi:hypothetical protein